MRAVDLLCALLVVGAVSIRASSEGSVSSLDQAVSLLRDAQEQLWRIVPPGDDPFYVHPDSSVRVVDWTGPDADWPDSLIRNIYAQVLPAGIAGADYPFYSLTMVEERDGSLVFYNLYGVEIFRESAAADYDPYALAKAFYGVSSTNELTAQQRDYGRSSNVGLELRFMLPEVFEESYMEDAASLNLSAASVPMSTLSLSPPVPGDGSYTNTGSFSSSTNSADPVVYITENTNGQMEVELEINDGWEPYAVVYGREQLPYGDWVLLDEWVPTFGREWMSWTDTVNTGKTAFFYEFFSAVDSDADGRADRVEQRAGSDPATADSPDADSDGIPDWWELKLYGTLSPASDFDGDGLLNAEELVAFADGTAVLYSDPALQDSDNDLLRDDIELEYGTGRMDWDSDDDALSDGEEVLTLCTDPNNPDTDPPTVLFSVN